MNRHTPSPQNLHDSATIVTSLVSNGLMNYRRAKSGKKTYLVVNGVPLVEGVLNKRFVASDEFGSFVNDWNDIPVVIYHPQENAGSARVPEPDVEVVGRFYNARIETGRLVGEFWLDEDLLVASKVGQMLLNKITAGKPVEVSTGYFSASYKEPGVWNEKEYNLVDRNIHPDHIALLPDQIGACSLDDGCGLNRNMKMNCSQCHAVHLKDYGPSLDKRIQMIRDTFYQMYAPTSAPSIAPTNCFIREIYDGYVIVEEGPALYKVGYAETEYGITFEPRDQWSEVEMDYRPVMNGGKGSGNFDRKGRPGQVGGSALGESSAKKAQLADDRALAVYKKRFQTALSNAYNADHLPNARDAYTEFEELVEEMQIDSEVTSNPLFSRALVHQIRQVKRAQMGLVSVWGEIVKNQLQQNRTGSLPPDGKALWEKVYQASKKSGDDEELAAKKAWGAVKRAGWSKQDGEWMKSNGGPGSGNFGHKGRPGEVGGSSAESLHLVGAKVPPQDSPAWKRNFRLGDEVQADYASATTRMRVTGIIVGFNRNDVIIKTSSSDDLFYIDGKNVFHKKYRRRLNGGPGSGNFGHKGRPGQIGGSAPDDEREFERAVDEIKDSDDEPYEDLDPIEIGNLTDLHEFLLDSQYGALIGRVSTYEEVGMLTYDKGVVYREGDREYQLTVVRTIDSSSEDDFESRVQDDLYEYLQSGEWPDSVRVTDVKERGYLTEDTGVELIYPDGERYVIDIVRSNSRVLDSDVVKSFTALLLTANQEGDSK